MKKALFTSVFFLCIVFVLPSHVSAQYGCGFCGDGSCACAETAVSCPADCSPATYTVTGNVFVDANSNGFKDGGESNYSGATVALTGNGSTSTNGSGNYTFSNISAGNYNVTLTLPVGYSATTTNPRAITLGPNSTVNFGIVAIPPPTCTGGMSVNPASPVNPGSSTTLSVTTCNNVENPNDGIPPPPFNWNPDTSGNSPPPTTSGQTDTSTSSTITWIAPACPASQTIYTPRVTVGGAGGTTNYSTSITVPSTVSITANVREVSSVGACTSSSGNAYNNGGTGASLNLTGGGGTVNQNQTTNGGTGQASFTCLPQGNYQLTLQVPSGYSVIGTDVTPAVESPIGSNGLSFATGSNNQSATFCIAPLDPWFQTDFGDVRFNTVNNPVPSGKYASSDTTFPGIFFSSESSNGAFGNGAVSPKGWFVNGEYSYNADTENKNGGMSYDFYKSKVKQDGVTCPSDPTKATCTLTPGILDPNQITGTGVYESNGDLTISSYNHVSGRRIVILVNGNATITTPISVPANQGVFIVAAKGNITIDESVGTVTPTSTTTSLDGYYTAQGSIIIDGGGCSDGSTSDKRLNVGGALVANSLKPFSSVGTGTVQNNRSMCLDNLQNPSLYVTSRLDFLTQLTDFYKTSYTKWQEVKP